jgi:hypothetical protein
MSWVPIPPSLSSPPLYRQNTAHDHPPVGRCHHDSAPIVCRHPRPILRAGAHRHGAHAMPFVHPHPCHRPHPVVIVHPSIPRLLVPSAPHTSHIAPLSPPRAVACGSGWGCCCDGLQWRWGTCCLHLPSTCDPPHEQWLMRLGQVLVLFVVMQ